MDTEDPASLLMPPSELRRLNWALAAFARSSAALMRFTNFEGLVPKICEAIVGDNDYLLATVGLAEDGPTKPIRLFAAAGRAAAYVDGINFSWSEDSADGRGPAGITIRSGKPLIMRDSETDLRFSNWLERARGFGIRSSVTVPFLGEDGTRGILIVYARRPDAFGAQELDVFAKLANELAFARSVQKARSDLLQSEASFRTMAENTSDIILKYDLEGCIVYASPSTRRYGYEPADLLGVRTGALVHPDDKDAMLERFGAIRQGRAIGSFEVRVRQSNGDFVWFESNPSPIRDLDGRVAGVTTVLRDVSERKRAEEALIESETRYRLLAENANDLIVQYDLQGLIVYASPSFRRYGFEPDAMLGREVGCMVHPDYRERAKQRFRNTLAGKADETETWEARAADGRPVWLEGRLSPFYDASGAIKGVLSAIRDVSERKAAEEALREVNAELSRVARVSALSAFSASLAHEINQPLSALVTNCEVARRWLSSDPPDLSKADRAIERSARDAQRASDIIGRMRAMVTKGPARIDDFDLNAAIAEVLALTQAEQQGANVTAALKLTNVAPIIRGDRVQFQQVVLNLIANAIEAMREAPEGDRTLMVRSAVVKGRRVLVEIEDRGPGLDPAQADRIFEHLFTTKAGGTGLGLSISKSIIEAQGGRIWAESATPNGARFCFELPLAAAG